jgi:hypothetical protein
MASEPTNNAEWATSTPIPTTEAAYLGWKSLMSIKASTANSGWSRGPCTTCTDMIWLILVAPFTTPHSKEWYNPSVGVQKEKPLSQLTRSSRSCDLCALIKQTIPTSSFNKWSKSQEGHYYAAPGSREEFRGPGNWVKHICVSANEAAARYLRVYTEAGGSSRVILYN